MSEAAEVRMAVDKQMQRRIGVSHNHVKRLVEPLMFRNHTVQELCEEEML